MEVAVCPDHRHLDATPTGMRRRPAGAVHPPDRDRNKLIKPEIGRQFPRQPDIQLFALDRGEPPPAKQVPRNLPEDSLCGDRVARHPENRFTIDPREQYRFPGPDRDTVEDDLPERADNICRVVPGTGRRTGREDDKVVLGDRFLKRPLDQVRVVGDDPIATAGRSHPGEVGLRHEGVCLDRLAGRRHHTERHEIAPRRDDPNPDRPHLHPGYAVGSKRASIKRPDLMTFREDKLTGPDILAGMPDVLPGRGRLPDPGLAVLVPGILDHDDGVKRRGKYLAGIDAGTVPKRQRPLVLCPQGIGALDRVTVERRNIGQGYRILCVQRFGCHPADSQTQRHGLGVVQGWKRPPHGRERIRERCEVQVTAWHATPR